MSSTIEESSVKVFVSSTFVDLVEHREEVYGSLARLDALVRGMEYFGSRPGCPKDECLDEVRRSHVYIGIFGLRYGTLDSASNLSLTHLEYAEALKLGKPQLIYMLDEESHMVLPKFVDRGESGERIGRLREELKSRFTVGFFSSPDDLARQVGTDLPPLLHRLGLNVQPSVLTHLVEALPGVDWLDEKRWQFIRKKLSLIAEQGIPEPVLRGVVEFFLSEDRVTATYLLAKGANLGMREAIDLGMDIEKVLASIVDAGMRAFAAEAESDNPDGA